MDRSFDFKRSAVYWKSLLSDDAQETPSTIADDVTSTDRFSILSSAAFMQLQLIDSIISPYRIIYNSDSTSKMPVKGELDIKMRPCVIKYMQKKREAFNKVGIENIVHDTKIIGQLIQQLKASLEKDRQFKKTENSSLINYRNGVVQCLVQQFNKVRDHVQEYERFRLKNEALRKSALKITLENLSSQREIKSNVGNVGDNHFIIPGAYLKNFLDDATLTQEKLSECTESDQECGKQLIETLQGRADTVDSVGIKKSVSFAPLPPYTKKGKSDARFGARGSREDSAVPMQDQQMQLLVMQHEKLLTRVQDEVHTLELTTISNVQQRLTEISNMFEKFSGTLAEQLDMFESINANVKASLSNITTSSSNLKKKSDAGLSHFQLLLCYAFIGSACFLLLVDFLKSSSGHYLY